MPFPPVALKVIEVPVLPLCVEGEQASAGFTTTLHVALCPPLVTVTVFVPALEKVVRNAVPEPEEGAPVDIHEYVLLEAPPEAVNEATSPILTICA